MTTTETPAPKPVEGSDGLLIEVDGQIVPNYDATLVPFEEGGVVTGKVVRIDQDEVLVDIGYKSEGVILANEVRAQSGKALSALEASILLAQADRLG